MNGPLDPIGSFGPFFYKYAKPVDSKCPFPTSPHPSASPAATALNDEPEFPTTAGTAVIDEPGFLYRGSYRVQNYVRKILECWVQKQKMPHMSIAKDLTRQK
jgi:hypothetical protein